MGRDKAQLRLQGQTFVTRIADALSPIVSQTSLVSAKLESAQLSLPLVADIYRDRGALGGLHAALVACRAAWLAVVSCDLPFVSSTLFERLVSLRRADTDAIVPLQADGRAQPLCALYRCETCLPVVERLLQRDELRPRVLLQQIRTRWVAPDELADLDQAELFFINVNTPADYALARLHAGDQGGKDESSTMSDE